MAASKATAIFEAMSRKPRTIIASPGDPDFDEKIHSAIRQKLSAIEGNQSVNNTLEPSE